MTDADEFNATPELPQLLKSSPVDSQSILAALLASNCDVFLSLPTDSVQIAVDVLQTELDFSTLDKALRGRCIACLRELARLHNIFPTSLFAREVTKTHTTPRYGDGLWDVYQGQLAGKCVAVKAMRLLLDDTREKVLMECRTEALLWRQIRHDNVLAFLGLNEDIAYPAVSFISPWLQHGDVITFLRERPAFDRLACIIDVAEGLRYLHSLDPPIVHGNLQGATIMVSDELRCCLADCGLAVVLENTFHERYAVSSSNAEFKGTLRWSPPEVLDPVLSAAAPKPSRDIYSLGCTIVEIYTGKPPYPHLRTDIQVTAEIIKGRLPDIPESARSSMPQGVSALVSRCIVARSEDRPSAAQAVAVLRDPDSSSSASILGVLPPKVHAQPLIGFGADRAGQEESQQRLGVGMLRALLQRLRVWLAGKPRS
ncbi:kinase-like protein [Cylindrobasidium torrendii FP15055 ss-10]|uniref:Kinase-like protein n=1 Tax=Cylindrobasidium torrendii FP15055 ss-10 TaxID=1314674 RepID=A0A0D7BJ49_9AGAR|nr:kinase-like protein [Cylindrobasidium torrendii FP15055 ss-10]